MTDHSTLVFRFQFRIEEIEATVPPLSTRQGEGGFQALSLSRGGRQFLSNHGANSAAVGGMPDIVANKPLLRLTARGWVRVATWSLLNITAPLQQDIPGFEPSPRDNHMQGHLFPIPATIGSPPRLLRPAFNSRQLPARLFLL